jgi:hypothetical protein
MKSLKNSKLCPFADMKSPENADQFPGDLANAI